jgi:hypothetical protein
MLSELPRSALLALSRLLLLGIGVALGIALWPLVLPLVALLVLAAVLSRAGAKGQRRPPDPQTPAVSPTPVGPVLDPQVRAQALAQVERINTEVHRERLERAFDQRQR